MLGTAAFPISVIFFLVGAVRTCFVCVCFVVLVSAVHLQMPVSKDCGALVYASLNTVGHWCVNSAKGNAVRAWCVKHQHVRVCACACVCLFVCVYVCVFV